MLRLQTAVDIKTSSERVWSVLMDFRRYRHGTRLSVEGEPRVGAVLNAFLQPPGSYGMRFRLRVVTLFPQREFRWSGRSFSRVSFRASISFCFEPVTPQSTRLVHGETQTPIGRTDAARISRHECGAAGRSGAIVEGMLAVTGRTTSRTTGGTHPCPSPPRRAVYQPTGQHGAAGTSAVQTGTEECRAGE